jgi:hypothetical protein
MRPHDGAADRFHDRGNGTDDWTPSRLRSIEEVPVALGFLVVTGGDLEAAIFGGANYGRDCDSIAGMAGAIAGALHGIGAIRPAWIEAIDRENRCDLRPLAHDLTALAVRLQQRQLAAANERAALFARMTEPVAYPVGGSL